MQILAQIHERHKAFHQAIARRAAMLRPAPAKPVEIVAVEPEPPPPPVLPPIPNALIAEASELVSPSWKVSIRKIQLTVCKDYGITFSDMISARRSVKISFPRQVAVYLCTKLTGQSLSQISRQFGRDHTTAIHASRKIERLLANDPELRARVDAIAESLGGVVE